MGNSDHESHPALARRLQAYLRRRNANARHPDVLAAGFPSSGSPATTVLVTGAHAGLAPHWIAPLIPPRVRGAIVVVGGAVRFWLPSAR